tara:strand:+ start:174 stop:578 length:405 start_codon:yes stop_codon:yes gene_type:complete
MIIHIKKVILGFFSLLCLFSLTFVCFASEVLADYEKQNNQFSEKIAKDYRKKFCNAIAFGLSKESAMNFANKENYLIFHDKKAMDTINKTLLANKIAIAVVENCGYQANLRGQEGISRFENDLISMKNTILEIN